ncbi:hypothetical protein Tco_0492907 [Tanacetum coccineum]
MHNPYGQPNNMFGQYEYGSQHIVGGSSSQPNGGSSSSLVQHFSLDDVEEMYPRRFLEYFREEQSPEDTALCKSCVRISEDSVGASSRKEMGFWVAVMKHMHGTCEITKRQTYNMINDKWKTVRPKVATFCGVYDNTLQTYTGGAIKDSPQFSEYFRKEQSPVEEVEDIRVPTLKKSNRRRQPAPTKKTMNRRRQPAPTKKTMNRKGEEPRCVPWTLEEDTALCKSCVRISEDSVVLELMAAELEARRMDQRQKDEALYLSTTDEELKEVLGAR